MNKIANITRTLAILKRHNFSFKKKFGQNFLVDHNTLESIVTLSGITDKTLVLEIGPGIGALTQYIAEKAKKVIAFEIDKSLEPLLFETLEGFDNVEVIFEDFLNADFESVIAKEEYEDIYVIANLPYYITTPIITRIIESNVKFNSMVMMMQKEVAQRFSANKSTKDFNSLSVFIQYHTDAKIILNVSKNVFIPKPNVDSAVIKLTRLEEPRVKVENQSEFFKFVRECFKMKRKTLRNNLKTFDIAVMEKVFNKLDISLTRRAESLTLEEFAAIHNEYQEMKQNS